ncbi:MAG: hypothetical protein HFF44_02970 [Lawsonibacter sp.]|nr:hypothetical protein [Lawsonibacter sp.]
MSKICVFCGGEIKRWEDEALPCGYKLETVCKTCWERYRNAPPIQRARLALESGRAEDVEGIQRFLNEEEAKEAQNAQRRALQRENLLCCGQEMKVMGKYSFQKLEGLFERFAPAMTAFHCERCGQVKFFDTRFLSQEQPEIDVSAFPPEPPKPTRSQPGKKPPWEK